MPDPSRPNGYVLDVGTAGAYARALGLDVDPGSARLLPGGVSSTVVTLDGAPPVVLKQALGRLRVASPWEADPRRSETEADALRLLHGITPDHVPAVLASDPAAHVVALNRAPAGWRDWRAALLDRPAEEDVARGRTAGRVLGRWHAATWGDAEVRAAFENSEAFDQLRLDPFHREIVRRGVVPEAQVAPLVDELAGERQCLVHGDFSPKNILVGDDGLWAIDAEVAHSGAAVFDLAFLVAHLALKALHAPRHADLLRRAGAAFVAGYDEENPGRVDAAGVARHAAALVLARVWGKSPAAYLDEPQRERAARIARDLLADPRADLDALWAAAAPASRPAGATA